MVLFGGKCKIKFANFQVLDKQMVRILQIKNVSGAENTIFLRLLIFFIGSNPMTLYSVFHFTLRNAGERMGNELGEERTKDFHGNYAKFVAP